MIFWFAAAAMSLLAVAMLLWPLLRRATPPLARAEYDLEIYRDQLVEIEHDVARGVLAADHAEAARLEISRRMLAADSVSAQEKPVPAGRARQSRWAGAIGVAVPIAAVLVYLHGGAPDLADAGKTAPPVAQKPIGDGIEELVERLARKLEERPDDVRGWSLMGRTLFSLRRFTEAAVAYANAVALDPGDATFKSRQAEALTFANGGTVTPAARALFAAVIERDANATRPRYYLGLADFQAGRRRAALDRWLALEADAPPDAPWLATLGPRIDRLAGQLGLDPVALRGDRGGTAATPAAPGPTAGDIAAAQDMFAQDRQAMIRSMVARLAARLDDQPDDAEGWARLARSYGVLGEPAKSRDAHARVAKLLPGDVGAQARYAASIVQAMPVGANPPAQFAPVIARILDLDPQNQDAAWLSGLAARRAGDLDEAARHWRRLLALLSPGSPEHARLSQRIKALAGK